MKKLLGIILSMCFLQTFPVVSAITLEELNEQSDSIERLLLSYSLDGLDFVARDHSYRQNRALITSLAKKKQTAWSNILILQDPDTRKVLEEIILQYRNERNALRDKYGAMNLIKENADMFIAEYQNSSQEVREQIQAIDLPGPNNLEAAKEYIAKMSEIDMKIYTMALELVNKTIDYVPYQFSRATQMTVDKIAKILLQREGKISPKEMNVLSMKLLTKIDELVVVLNNSPKALSQEDEQKLEIFQALHNLILKRIMKQGVEQQYIKDLFFALFAE